MDPSTGHCSLEMEGVNVNQQFGSVQTFIGFTVFLYNLYSFIQQLLFCTHCMSGMLHSWGHPKKGNSGLSVWVRVGTEISPPLPIFHDGPSLLDVFGEPLYALSSQ